MLKKSPTIIRWVEENVSPFLYYLGQSEIDTKRICSYLEWSDIKRLRSLNRPLRRELMSTANLSHLCSLKRPLTISLDGIKDPRRSSEHDEQSLTKSLSVALGSLATSAPAAPVAVSVSWSKASRLLAAIQNFNLRLSGFTLLNSSKTDIINQDAIEALLGILQPQLEQLVHVEVSLDMIDLPYAQLTSLKHLSVRGRTSHQKVLAHLVEALTHEEKLLSLETFEMLITSMPYAGELHVRMILPNLRKMTICRYAATARPIKIDITECPKLNIFRVESKVCWGVCRRNCLATHREISMQIDATKPMENLQKLTLKGPVEMTRQCFLNLTKIEDLELQVWKVDMDFAEMEVLPTLRNVWLSAPKWATAGGAYRTIWRNDRNDPLGWAIDSFHRNPDLRTIHIRHVNFEAPLHPDTQVEKLILEDCMIKRDTGFMSKSSQAKVKEISFYRCRINPVCFTKYLTRNGSRMQVFDRIATSLTGLKKIHISNLGADVVIDLDLVSRMPRLEHCFVGGQAVCGYLKSDTLLSATLTNEDPIDRDMICDNLASVLCLPKLRELHLEGTHLDYLGLASCPRIENLTVIDSEIRRGIDLTGSTRLKRVVLSGVDLKYPLNLEHAPQIELFHGQCRMRGDNAPLEIPDEVSKEWLSNFRCGSLKTRA